MIHLLTTLCQCSDWKDLVKEAEQPAMERLLGSPLAQEVAAQQHSKMPRPPNTYKSSLDTVTVATALIPPQSLYFDRSVEKLLAMFSHSDPQNGLASASVASLRDHHGPNRLPDPPRPNALYMLWLQLTDLMVIILIIAAIIQCAEKEFNSAAVLLVVIVLNTIIGFSQEWKASKTLNALMNLSVPMAQVIRDGEQQMIGSEDLVPGDVVVLEEGEAVPADLRLIEVSQLELIESILTGESVPSSKSTDAVKAKSRRIPLGDCIGNAFMATTVARGRGKGIVVRTGVQTEIGKISTAIQKGSKRKTKTPIQRKLARLGLYLVALAVVLCALVVVIGIAWKKDVKTMVNIGLSLAVSVIPEGLVAVTTVTMALGVRRMATKHCIVRTLPAVESLGSVTVICSDKTGTLTQGKMGTSELWTADNALYRFTKSTSMDPSQGQILIEPAELRRRMIHVRRTAPSYGSPMADNRLPNESQTVPDYSALRTHPLDPTNPSAYTSHLFYALMVAGLCNNSSIVLDEETGEYTPIGDPTEIALTVAAQKAGLGPAYWSQQVTKVFERAFDSERKLMSSIYASTDSNKSKNINDTSNEVYVLCKGAPEELVDRCSMFMASADDKPASSTTTRSPQTAYQAVPITEEFAALVADESSRMASQGLRVLGLGVKTAKLTQGWKDTASIESEPSLSEDELVFVGLIGLLDPPKQGVKEAVQVCQEAGIRVMMITGDHVQTATSIAAKLGIYQQGVPGMCRAILGRELDLLSEDALLELDPFPNVFARVSPDNKLTIVNALQQRGELVAMTGDGVNDAPAIKAADVGVAMGIAGTEITKQAADLVLLNDNFATIVAAVEEGRHVFDNILKFILYLLSCNGAEIFLMLICAIANLETPLTVMMILWANIIADVPPAMALGVEPKERDLMKRSPRNPKMGVLTKVSWTIIFFQSLMMAALTIGTYVLSLRVYNYTIEDARSLAFATITTIQLLHSFMSRSSLQSIFKTGVLGNRWMVGAFFISAGFLLLGIYAPGISTWLELTPVSGKSWIMIVVCVAIFITFVECEKWIVRKLGGIV
ncbi:hypothetical protein J3Q64DRAFT_1770100 [Phycomyces blakesleeanus]|uniref:Cation-transporting P-type ATPase N-terminal domain-containing protein n=1 Tax=Phycomyces blakesleeanus TaxID=4837 RepID=A0ABR3AMT9_PHYBL